MKIALKLFSAVLALTPASIATAGTASYTGTFTTPEGAFETTTTFVAPGTLALQSWSFGGGTNAAGKLIPGGGFDPLVSVFAGTGPAATFVNATSDLLPNYLSFSGCPPAALGQSGPTKGLCGDIRMSLSLAPGTYTIVLSDANYIPAADLDNGGTLGEGFADETNGAFPFKTCPPGDDCSEDTPNWALDVTTPSSRSTPEPRTAGIAGLGLLALALRSHRQRRPAIVKLSTVNRDS